LISSRHCSTIYYVSAADGSIIWALNGIEPALSNYTLEGFNFSFQHDIRFHSRSRTHNSSSTIISIFDNGSNGTEVNAAQSQGLVIELSSSTEKPATKSTTIGVAKLIAAYPAPPAVMPLGVLSGSQGNMQILPNGHALIGWGINPYISEHLADGTPVYFASFDASVAGNSYRAYKANFTGNPISSPAIYSYALNGSVPVTHYVSWNGCTKCTSWRFYEGATAKGPFTLASTEPIARKGFETSFTGYAFAAYAYAEALDADGAVLGRSQVEKTFVPGSILGAACNGIQCPPTSVFSSGRVS
jgi:hypothetical protein